MSYDPTLTMGAARAVYFEANGFPDDGGYSKKWVALKVGPIPFAIPNTASRKRAVRYHDLHHLLTGYATDWKGEFEISAWEIGGSCRDYTAAWVLNLGGLFAGAVLWPGAIWRAFVRGRRSGNLYGRGYESLLDRTVGDLQAELGLEREPEPAPGDRLAFAGWLGVAALLAAAQLAPLVLAFAGLWWWLA